jgi:GntR family transcriptional regulator
MPDDSASPVASPMAERLRTIAREAGLRGERLLSEPALAAELGVSRPALREELARCESEGLIRRRHGSGTIVNVGAFDLAARFDEQVDFARVLVDAGYSASVELLDSGTVRLTPSDAEVLQLEAGALAFRTVKRWLADARPAMLAVDVVPIPPGRGDLPPVINPMVGLFTIARALSGESVEWELAWPGAVNATAAIADPLELARRAAVMTLDLVGISRSGGRLYRALEYHVPGIVRSGFVRTVHA